MDTDEFSFPRISDTHAHAIDSPPLWNLSPAASPNPYQRNKGEEDCDFFGAKLISQVQRKSFSSVETRIQQRTLLDDDEEEEKMDLLWEDFNEELMCSSTTGSSATSSSREVVEFRCATPASSRFANNNNNNNNGALVPAAKNINRPSMVVIVKVLKKLFSVNNYQKQPRRRVR
ncbi:hypothetical protein HN51_053149 [Arachis hypogaea]|uniref:Uncharacterized protein n=1 Tax=Arachis hypogaea TaxID=3818 RepID=A0A444XBG9_ARAHY|nr:uncharacterized protein LOC107642250 [Arachis ipaensis]XP_025657191.1 uncharacterized protein LOC112752035 [Arachis hypogaea]QHN75463.1 uncharacterized protein DS421_19g635530 [Arachis hypogaea]RYQ87055.1 hypothetical protein Ahy_B09g094547 [Arachis hypogaea]